MTGAGEKGQSVNGAKHSPSMTHFAKSHDPKLRLTISGYSIDFLTWFTISRHSPYKPWEPILEDPVSLDLSSKSSISEKLWSGRNRKLALHVHRNQKNYFSAKFRIRFRIRLSGKFKEKTRIRFHKDQELINSMKLSIWEKFDFACNRK